MKTATKIAAMIAVMGLENNAGGAENEWHYDTRQMHGWTVKVDTRLLNSKSVKKTERNMMIVDADLASITKVIPAEILKTLREIKIYVTPTKIRKRGLPQIWYIGDLSYAPTSYKKNDPQIVGIQLGDFHGFKRMSKTWPWLILHEFAHAYHDKVLGWKNWRIHSAYKRAMKTSLYDDSYAKTNVGEFFAVATSAYFGRDKDYPFNRERLEKDDPKTAALIRKLWKVE